MTIETFIEARLAEDEQIARDASIDLGTNWTHTVTEDYPGQYSSEIECGGDRFARVDYEGSAVHIAHQDPLSVLDRVEALRELLEFYAETREIWKGDYLKADFVLGKLASTWRGHPDYRQEWNG